MPDQSIEKNEKNLLRLNEVSFMRFPDELTPNIHTSKLRVKKRSATKKRHEAGSRRHHAFWLHANPERNFYVVFIMCCIRYSIN